jgi:alcohol dehydrogenase (cytochrome c)
VRALDPETGSLKWEFKTASPASAGILTTAGELLFTGTSQGDFIALNSTTGAVLWRFKGGLSMGSNPVTYQVDGRQYVATAIGRALFVFDLME